MCAHVLFSNRNSEIDRAVRDGKPFDQFLPAGFEPPALVPRIVPDPDEDEYGLEVGDDNSMVWGQIAGRWELGKVEGKRGTGSRRKLVVTVEGVEHEIGLKEATQVQRSERGAEGCRAPPPPPTPHARTPLSYRAPRFSPSHLGSQSGGRAGSAESGTGYQGQDIRDGIPGTA